MNTTTSNNNFINDLIDLTNDHSSDDEQISGIKRSNHVVETTHSLSKKNKSQNNLKCPPNHHFLQMQEAAIQLPQHLDSEELKLSNKNKSMLVDLTSSPIDRTLTDESVIATDIQFIYNAKVDNSTVSSGILYLIHNLNFTNVATCISPAHSSTEVTTEIPITTTAKDPMLYITQNDKWSCGFRNLQMILGSLILLSNHNNLSRCLSTITTVPSVNQLQSYMEASWKEGYDAKGAKHFNNRIRGRKSKIGAMEVSSLLAYLSIDSTVIQFIACNESRSALGKFVWAYFNRSCRYQFSLSSENAELSTAASFEVVHHLLSLPSNSSNDRLECCNNFLLPLYLQWQGHSVTIVGIEKARDGNNFDLLVFDPSKCGDTLKEKLRCNIKSRRRVDTTNMHLLSNQCLAPMRLSTKSLLRKDCQLILCTMKPVDGKKLKDTNVATASLEAVERFISANKNKYGL